MMTDHASTVMTGEISTAGTRVSGEGLQALLLAGFAAIEFGFHNVDRDHYASGARSILTKQAILGRLAAQNALQRAAVEQYVRDMDPHDHRQE